MIGGLFPLKKDSVVANRLTGLGFMQSILAYQALLELQGVL